MVLLPLGGILVGCSLSMPAAPAVMPDLNAVNTAAAATVQAMTTQSIQPGSTSVGPQPSDTPAATQNLPPAFTPTALPPSATPTAVSTCDRAEFVTDVRVKDGDAFAPNTAFTKIWRMKNVGTCTWSSGYSLVFVSGERMNGPESKSLGATVAPGQTIDLALALKAPAATGTYQGYWQLRNASGIGFGIGSDGLTPFWVTIKVSTTGSTSVASGPTRTPTPKPVDDVVYSFVKKYCDADWSTGSGDLPCPGTEGDEDGFIVKLAEPVLEGGRKENESALWTEPEHTDGGRISGVFPSFEVKTGDRFRAAIGCLESADECDVQFKLQYRIGSGETKTLEDWNEDHDGEFQKIDLDLSSLAGKDVKFILTVKEAGDYDEPGAFWLSPRIMR
jgi:hypothetical protein